MKVSRRHEVKLPKRSLIGLDSKMTLGGDLVHVTVIASRIPTRREFSPKCRFRI